MQKLGEGVHTHWTHQLGDRFPVGPRRYGAGVVSVEEGPARCEACWWTFGPNRCLVGWDNLHDPPCRTYHCRWCGHTTHDVHAGRRRAAADWPRRRSRMLDDDLYPRRVVRSYEQVKSDDRHIAALLRELGLEVPEDQ